MGLFVCSFVGGVEGLEEKVGAPVTIGKVKGNSLNASTQEVTSIVRDSGSGEVE